MNWRRLIWRATEEVAPTPEPETKHIPPQPGDLVIIGDNSKLIRYHSPFHACPECGCKMLKLSWSDSDLMNPAVPTDELGVGPVCANCESVPFAAFVGVGR